jgi:hypothetical protein
LSLHRHPKVDAFLERNVLNLTPLHHHTEIAGIDLGAPGNPDHQKAGGERPQADLFDFLVHISPV